MDDLERRVGFARTCCHNKQNAVLPTGNGINSAVDGDTLIVARCFVPRLEIVWLGDELLLFRREVFIADVPPPEILVAMEIVPASIHSLFAGFHIVF